MPLDSQSLILAGCVLAAIALWAAMAQRAIALRLVASAAAVMGLLMVVRALDGPGGEITNKVLFWLFAGGAIGGGVLMISGRDPVHGALWFAVATLCVCGLFLLLSAPFLAAATIIVYAGAIIVTFMFVIMLAQQGGATAYDQRLRLPLPGSLVSFAVLGALAFTLLDWQTKTTAAPDAAAGPALVAAQSAAASEAAAADAAPPAKAKVTPEQMGNLQTLGKTLFVDYLFAVELGGTLLLVATIGAIALAPRRQRGNL